MAALIHFAVEFIKLEDWFAELKVLVDECSTMDGNIYAKRPDEKQEIAAAAWSNLLFLV